MELTLKRRAKRENYTIGTLYIDGRPFCDTLEDTVRTQKIPHHTAIPTGRYHVLMNGVSPKYSNYARYPWAKPYGGKLPRLKDVPQFEGILIHPGNTAEDTSGCILVGENKVVGRVLNSVSTFHRLMEQLLPVHRRGERIWITVE